jgi:ABC-type multidrug transport system fused ATPase/permease subunit
MSQSDPTPADPHQQVSLAAPEELFGQALKALGKVVESITPWLVEFGSWLFGGLIAFNLLVIAALITVGPVDPAILVSTAAFALALPVEVAGLFLLHLDQNLKQVGFEEAVAQAIQEMPFAGSEQIPSPSGLETQRKRRTRRVLSFGLGILALSVVLTVIGMMAAMWHMAWWIGVAFLATVLISLGVVIAAIVTRQPPDSAKRKERKTNSSSSVTEEGGT